MIMPDQLYLSLWFSRFEEPDMLRHAASVMRQFAFSEQRSGITYLAMHPISWSEPTILEKRFEPPVPVEEATMVAAEFLRSDQACVFSAFWDLWVPEPQSGNWHSAPVPVKFVVQGEEFEEETAEETGRFRSSSELTRRFSMKMRELMARPTNVSEPIFRNWWSSLSKSRRTAGPQGACFGPSPRTIWHRS